jgi:hypothetical protein
MPSAAGSGPWWERARASRHRTPVAIAFALVALGLAVLVADNVSKGDITREAIASVAFLLVAVDLLVFFGPTVFGIVGAAFAFASISGAQIADLLPDGPRDPTVAYCPDAGPAGEFSGTVFKNVPEDGAAVREEANTDSEIVERYTPRCRQHFRAWCIGETRTDLALRTPDALWYELSSRRGYMASATVKVREPPVNLRFNRCPGGRPPAVRPTIVGPRGPTIRGKVTVEAEAPRAPFVGFVAYFADKPGQPASATWHFIAQDVKAADGISASWDTRSVPGRNRGSRPAVVAAVPCYTAAVPAHVQGMKAYRVGDPGARPVGRELTPGGGELVEARRQACKFQGG